MNSRQLRRVGTGAPIWPRRQLVWGLGMSGRRTSCHHVAWPPDANPLPHPEVTSEPATLRLIPGPPFIPHVRGSCRCAYRRQGPRCRPAVLVVRFAFATRGYESAEHRGLRRILAGGHVMPELPRRIHAGPGNLLFHPVSAREELRHNVRSRRAGCATAQRSGAPHRDRRCDRHHHGATRHRPGARVRLPEAALAGDQPEGLSAGRGHSSNAPGAGPARQSQRSAPPSLKQQPPSRSTPGTAALHPIVGVGRPHSWAGTVATPVVRFR